MSFRKSLQIYRGLVKEAQISYRGYVERRLTLLLRE